MRDVFWWTKTAIATGLLLGVVIVVGAGNKDLNIPYLVDMGIAAWEPTYEDCGYLVRWSVTIPLLGDDLYLYKCDTRLADLLGL